MALGEQSHGGIPADALLDLATAYAEGIPQTVYVETYLVDHDQVCHIGLAEQSYRSSKVTFLLAGSGLLVGPRQVWTARHVFSPVPRYTQAVCALVYYDLDKQPITSQRLEYREDAPDGLSFEGRDIAIITLSVAPPGERSCITVNDLYRSEILVTKNGFVVPPERVPKALGSPVVRIEFGDPERGENGNAWFHSLMGDCSSGKMCRLTGPTPPGNSGGPVWTENGELIGIIVAERVEEAQSTTYVEELASSADYIASKSCSGPSSGVKYIAGWTLLSDPSGPRDGIPVINLEVIDPSWEDLPAQIILEFPDPLRRVLPIEIGTNAAASISILDAGIVVTDEDISNGRVVYAIDWLRATQRIGPSIRQEEGSINLAQFPIYYATPGYLFQVPIDVTILNNNGEIIPELSDLLSAEPVVPLRNSGLFKPVELATDWLSRIIR